MDPDPGGPKTHGILRIRIHNTDYFSLPMSLLLGAGPLSVSSASTMCCVCPSNRFSWQFWDNSLQKILIVPIHLSNSWSVTYRTVLIRWYGSAVPYRTTGLRYRYPDHAFYFGYGTFQIPTNNRFFIVTRFLLKAKRLTICSTWYQVPYPVLSKLTAPLF